VKECPWAAFLLRIFYSFLISETTNGFLDSRSQLLLWSSKKMDHGLGYYLDSRMNWIRPNHRSELPLCPPSFACVMSKLKTRIPEIKTRLKCQRIFVKMHKPFLQNLWSRYIVFLRG
jgi:hypothetical protein